MDDEEALRRRVRHGNRQTRCYHLHVGLLIGGMVVFAIGALAGVVILVPVAGLLLVGSGVAALLGGRSVPFYLGSPGLARHLAEARGRTPGTGLTAIVLGALVVGTGIVMLVGGLMAATSS